MKPHIFLMIFSMLSFAASGAEHGGGGGEKPAAGKEGGKAKADKGKQAEEGAAPESVLSPYEQMLRKNAEAADSLKYTNNYVHKWLPFPSFTSKTMPAGENVKIKPEKGVISVLFFTASWCVPCQEMTRDFKLLQQRYARANVKFYYVFSHDYEPDIKAFIETYQIKDGLLGTHDTLKEFHNPQLPSIYLSDRDRFLLTRFLKAKPSDLKKIEDILFKMATI